MTEEGSESKEAVQEALRAGFRHIDTAEGYCNEGSIGAAISDSGLARPDIFITTKAWPGNYPAGKYPAKGRDDIIESCEKSLRELGTDYVDLYLIHGPFAGPELRLEQWAAMLELKQRGLAKSVGVSNFGEAHLLEIEGAEMELPAANQLELHPLSTKGPLLAYMQTHAILPIAYSSLAPLSGWRADQGLGYELEELRASATAAALLKCRATVAQLAQQAGVSDAVLLLRWAATQGWPVLPKSCTTSRIRQNAGALAGAAEEWQLTAEQVATLSAFDCDATMAWVSGDPTHTA